MHPVRVTNTLALLLLLTLLSTPALAQPRLDRNAPTAQGLLAWWRVVAGVSGGRTWYDLTGRFPLAVTNIDTAGSSGAGATTRPGGQGEMRFDGTNDYATHPVTAQLWPPAVSILLWMKRTATGNDYQGLVTGGNNSGFRDIIVRSSGGMNVSFVTSTSSYLQQDNANPGAIPVGVWTHLAYTYSSATGLQGYTNCLPTTFNGASGTMYPVTTLPTVVGTLDVAAPSLYFPGAMDDIKLYNRALSGQEVCQVMRDSQRGEPKLLPPSLLVGVVPPLVVGGPKSRFFPFFQAP